MDECRLLIVVPGGYGGGGVVLFDSKWRSH